MAFFDIGINVNVNLGASLNNINNFVSSMQRLGQVGAQPAQQVAQGFQRIQSAAASTQSSLSGFQTSANSTNSTLTSLTRGLNSFQQVAAQTASRTAQAEQSIRQLGITTQNTLTSVSNLGNTFRAALAPIQSGVAPLTNLNNQLGTMSQQFITTERSGSRFAELFRGNRGLVFGLSATFGTITGVVFELQLMNDANKQVAESQAVLNDLVAQGKEGTAQYQQAQQALGKDMRFLEFTTRNLALAFTNFIPDVIMLINGVLGLRDRIGHATQGMKAFAVETKGAATAVTALNVAQGAGGGAGGIIGRFAGFASFAGPIGLAIAGITAVIGFITLLTQKTKEMDDAALASANASRQATEVRISDAQAFTNATIEAWGVHENELDAFLSKHTSVTDGAISNLDRLSTATAGTNVVPGQPKGQTVEDLGTEDQSKNLDVLGGVGKWFQDNMGDPFKNFTQEGQDKSTRRVQETYSGSLGSGGFNEREIEMYRMYNGNVPGYARSVPPSGTAAGAQPQIDWVTAQSLLRTMAAEQGLKATMAGGLNVPGIGRYPISGLLSGPEFQQIMSPGGLREQADIARGEIPKIAEGLPGAGQIDWKSAEAAEYFAILQQINDITSDNTDITENNNNAKEAEAQRLKEITQAQNEHNQIIDRLPRILQETGEFTKIRNNDLIKEEQLLHTAMTAYVDYGLAIGENVNLQKAIVAEGNRVVTGLYEQRDAIQGANIFWENMNATTQEQIQITQQQVLASIDVTQALTNQEKQQYLVNQGHIAGKLAGQQFLETTIAGAAQNKQYGISLMDIANNLTNVLGETLGSTIPSNIQLTNAELETLITTFYETGSAAEALANMVNERLASSMEVFEGITGAMTDTEFRGAFKEIDFGDLNMEAWKDLKNLAKDMKDVATEGIQMKNIIDALIQGLNTGDLKKSTFRQGIDEIAESIQNVIDIDPHGAALQPFVDFLNNLDAEERKGVVALLGDDIQYLATAMADKDLTPEEVLAFFERLGIKAGDSAENIEDAVESMQESARILSTGLGPILDPNQGRKESPEESKTRFFKGSLAADDQIKENDKKQDPAKVYKTQVDAINAATKTAQTAMANLSTQGSNSIALLIKNIAPHVKTMDTYFRTTVPAAIGATITSLAVMSELGVKNIQALIEVNNVYDSTVAQIMTDVGIWMETNDDLIESLGDVAEEVGALIEENNILARTIVQIDNNFQDAADTADDFASKLDDVTAAAKRLKKALDALPSGGAGGLESAQGGFHTNRLDRDTIILAHEGESVNIGPGMGSDTRRTTARGGGGGDTINLTVVTHNELDGELIGTAVTRKTFRKLSTR